MARMDGGGRDTVVGMVSFSIPIRRSRYDAGVAEARARHVAASHAAQGRELGLEAEIRRALFAYRDGQRKLELYGGTLLPKARQSLASTEAAYRTGEAGFSDLIDAQRVLLEFALAHERAADGSRAGAGARSGPWSAKRQHRPMEAQAHEYCKAITQQAARLDRAGGGRTGGWLRLGALLSGGGDRHVHAPHAGPPGGAGGPGADVHLLHAPAGALAQSGRQVPDLRHGPDPGAGG
jgi:hypothetical protein